ncbi:MAG: hypothetical protein ACJAT7_000702 [Psychromonas sp.]|jgi:hypothetical protein|uniref:ATP-grasp fold amidoligase family protein n=1 Tax=Psychromonas sp. TaxID=1884585 RepID=UPI0039E22C55
MINNIKKLLKSNANSHIFFLYVKNTIAKLECIFISDERAIKKKYYSVHKKELNLKNPILFNEKIQWLKLNYRKKALTLCADKYAVREYVSNILGDDVLNELYGVYNDVNEIDFNSLPKEFVLKVTHGSGQNLITQNKESIDWAYEKKQLNFYMHSNHYLEGREWVYKNIPPRIICEKYLDENGKPPVDYKFFCFNGEPRFIQLDLDRFDSHKRNMYDTNWNALPFEFQHQRDLADFERPKCLELMLTYAQKLAGDFPFARVDFYLVNGKIIFGEITFHPEQGLGRFIPESYNMMLGKQLNLPVKG